MRERLARIGTLVTRNTYIQAIAKAGDDTSNDQLSVTERCSLDDGPDYHDNSTKYNCLTAAKTVADP